MGELRREHRVPRRLPPRALSTFAIACALLAACALARAGDAPEIPAAEAAQHVGEVVRVCGHVASAAYFASVKGSPTFLNIDRAYPDQLFTIVIWGDDRSRFDGPPERLFDGKSLCVTGRIESYRGRPEVVVDDPDQIVVTATAGGGGGLTEVEGVFVKALLALMGHDANYGSGAWDEEAVEAAISFQEASAIPPTGEPDAVTLRALAERIPEIPEADRTMIIRLLLFELARRQE